MQDLYFIYGRIDIYYFINHCKKNTYHKQKEDLFCLHLTILCNRNFTVPNSNTKSSQQLLLGIDNNVDNPERGYDMMKTQVWPQGFSQKGVQPSYGCPFLEEIQGKFT